MPTPMPCFRAPGTAWPRLCAHRGTAVRHLTVDQDTQITQTGCGMQWSCGPSPRNSAYSLKGTSVQSLSRVRLFATPWTAARQASLSVTISRSLLKLMSIKSDFLTSFGDPWEHCVLLSKTSYYNEALIIMFYLLGFTGENIQEQSEKKIKHRTR